MALCPRQKVFAPPRGAGKPSSFASARPASISKYCLGTCLTRPDVPDQPWTSLLRRHFTPNAHTKAREVSA